MRNGSGIQRLFIKGLTGVVFTTALSSIIAVSAILFLIYHEVQGTPKIDKPARGLEHYAARHAAKLLSGDPVSLRELAHRADGMDYVILDSYGKPVGGDKSTFQPLPKVKQLASLLNTSRATPDQRHIQDIVPLVYGGRVGGYILVRYSSILNPALRPAKEVGLLLLMLLAALLPAALLAASTVFFARRATRKLGTPITELMDATEKIRNRDLDFEISYDGDDELGDLCRAVDRLRSELRDSLEREWRQRQQIEDTLAVLSHDLRTPATVILGHVEGLSRVSGSRRAQRLERYLPVLEGASRKISYLLNDILLLTELEQGSLKLEPRPISLTREMERKEREYRLRASEQGIALSLEIYGTPPGGEICLDLYRLEEVLDNLFENALRFTPPGGDIKVEVAHHEHELEVSVRDTGPGVDPRHLPHVFERFYSAESPRGGKSSGLGLYISRMLIERQGGEISLNNHPGGGCEARFTLPISSSPHVSPTTHPLQERGCRPIDHPGEIS
ncbi:HAMP domain-containing sensor histidine kinase [Rubrobacter calidifluminis]|uniref:HAMP domain-containing sensor histidine kinase n=1 Tax=Rubrobacter calidifluminis TaxID=1392640 RepID=UPI0023620982|nr:HAMP domain-containing sensor histidine kinase [Rubrobacter calidifluminis]